VELGGFLAHADPNTTMQYLGHLRGDPDRSYEAKVGLSGIGRLEIEDAEGRVMRKGKTPSAGRHSAGRGLARRT
jgi:hypothetical protein